MDVATQERLTSLTHLLEKTEQRRRDALSLSGVGIWEWDVKTGKLWWDDEMLKMYGITRADFEDGYDDWSSRIHPYDLEKAEKQIKDCLEKKAPYIFRFRVVRPDKTEVVISGFGNCIRNSKEEPIRMVGINVFEGELCDDHYDRMQSGDACETCPSRRCLSWEHEDS